MSFQQQQNKIFVESLADIIIELPNFHLSLLAVFKGATRRNLSAMFLSLPPFPLSLLPSQSQETHKPCSQSELATQTEKRSCAIANVHYYN